MQLWNAYMKVLTNLMKNQREAQEAYHFTLRKVHAYKRGLSFWKMPFDLWQSCTPNAHMEKC